MKLDPDFLIHETGDEVVLIPTGGTAFSGVVKGNKSFGSIVKLLQNEITEEQLVLKMLDIYDAEQDVIEKDVKDTVEKLRGIGAVNG